MSNASEAFSRRSFLTQAAAAAFATTSFGILPDLAEAVPRVARPTIVGSRTALEWVVAARDAVLAAKITPPSAARLFAYTSIAMYESLVPAMPTLRPLSGQLNDLGRGSLPTPPRRVLDWPTVMNGATHRVLAGLLHDHRNVPDAVHENVALWRSQQYQRRLLIGIDRPVLRRSLRHGASIGELLLEWARVDGWRDQRDLAPMVMPDRPGVWQPTPPAFAPAVESHVATVRTLVLDSAASVAAPAAIPYSEDPTSDFYREAAAVRAIGAALTDEQRAIATFWGAPSTTTPPGHWIGLVAQLGLERRIRLQRAVELYALTSITAMDAMLACWQAKYDACTVRPVTYIRKTMDPNWTPALTTPAFPEHPSGHAVCSRAVATVLTDNMEPFAYTDRSHRGALPPRSYQSFHEAADESTISRIYGGIHFQRGCDAGAVMGNEVALQVRAGLKTRRG